jgi:glycine/D-amino acid oxidase-like deaminating enzyme
MPLREYPYWWDGLQAFRPPESQAHLLEGQAPAVETRVDGPAPIRRTCDVAVIGAGYTGLSAARHLAAAGASVLVLDRERVGWGASSRNGGQVLTGLSVDPATLVARHGETEAARLFEFSLDAIARLEALILDEAIDCDYEASAHLMAASKPGHFAGFREEQALLARVFQHRVELVSAADQRSEIGSDRYHGLLVDERSRGLHPARFVIGLAEAARRAGAVIVEATPVGRLTQQGRRWNLATSLGLVDAADVIIATNGYTDGAAPALRRRLVPIGSYIVATEPLDVSVAQSLLPRRRMAFDSKHFLYYFRVTRDRRLVFGGRAEFSTPTAETARRAAAALRRGIVEVFPELATVQLEFAWGGNVAFTRDRMPHAGRLDGAYYAAGYCGHGVAMATFMGELVAQSLTGAMAEHPLLDRTGAAFPAIPFYRGDPWFLPVAEFYYRLRDVLE